MPAENNLLDVEYIMRIMSLKVAFLITYKAVLMEVLIVFGSANRVIALLHSA